MIITIVLKPRAIEIHEAFVPGAKETAYYHPDVKIMQVGTFSGSGMNRSQLNYALCAWLQDHHMRPGSLKDMGARR